MASGTSLPECLDGASLASSLAPTCGKRYNLLLESFPARPCVPASVKSQNYKSKEFFMAIPATQMRPGMIIKHNNELHAVFSVEHRTPGNLRAFIQAKLRNLRSGAMFEHRFRSAD